MKPRSRLFLIACLGLGGLATAWWQWPSQTSPTTERSPARATAALPAAANSSPARATAADAGTAGILAALEALLADREARAKEALLTFKDDASLARFLARARQAGLTVVDQLDGLRTVRVRYDALAALQKELLAHASDYSAVGANSLINVPSAPAKEDRAAVNPVPFGNDTLAFLGAAVDRSTWGRGVTIAILDTGVGADPTFGTGRLRTLDIGLGTAPGRGEDDGHGTAVAALAAGLAPDAPGVAPAAGLLSIRVTDADGVSDIFTVSQAILAAVNAGAKIINVSLGGYSTNAALEAAIGYALDRGALVVAAAGNDQAAQLAWPAADARVVSVGAVDKAEQQVSFSNSGPQLTLSAPGYGVQTAWLDGQRAYVDGTSASAPIVAGALAAVLSQNPALSPQQALQLLTDTASDSGAPGTDPAFGHGILNLGWAMNTQTPGYVDTAVASHYFDAAKREMEFVIQNRSSQPVAGLSLALTVGGTTTNQTLPALAAGESRVVTTPVDPAALKTAGTLRYTTLLANPAGVTDRVPANNRKASVLSAPAKN